MNESIEKLIEEAKKEKSLSILNNYIDNETWLKITKLTELEWISLTRCKIEISTDISLNFPNLKTLQINDCSLLPIPKPFNFEDFNLDDILNTNESENQQQKKYSLTLNTANLESLSLSETNIENYIGFEKLINLTYISLSKQKLEKIPDFIFEFSGLKSIFLYGNKITKIPEKIKNLKQTETLNLSDNNINKLPNEIFKLPNLKNLDIENNQIKTIPQEIFYAENLDDIQISSNTLNALEFYYNFKNKDEARVEEIFSKLEDDIEKDTFNFKETNYEITFGKKFIFIKNQQNYGFLHFATFHKHMSRDDFFLICIFGKEETRKNVLSVIRKKIDTWLENKNKVLNTIYYQDIEVIRTFIYPISEKEQTTIDLDKLLKAKFEQENSYKFKYKNQERERPINELLEYIGAENDRITTEWIGKSYITKIEIENFKIFSNIRCDLSEHINILIGKNGLGKTSFLQALTLGLLPKNNKDKSNEFGKYITIDKKNSAIKTHWGEEYREVYIYENEIGIGKQVDFPQKLILAYGVNLNTDEKFPHTDIIKNLIDGNNSAYFTKSIFKDFSTDFYDPIILLERLFTEKKGTESKLIDNIINLIKNTINKYLDLFSEPEKINIKGDFANYYYLDFNNNKLQTSNLSEGYKDFVLQITDIIVRIIASRNIVFKSKQILISEKLFKEVNGVVIIDEFDRHLHPVLQRKFLHQLKKDFQNIQFILSTHNIFSLQSAEGFSALILNLDKSQLKIDTKSIKKGLSLESINNEYFNGNNSIFSYQIEYLLTNFKKYIDKQRKQKLNNQEQKEFKMVTDELISCGERTKGIVSREIRQLERLTGKSITI